MTPRPHPSQPERRAEQAVKVCVPKGFFERLTSTCDFRAITRPFFSLYDLRPQSSESDPVLFFKILLLEYILEVSNDVLRKEFTSHPGLRAFLNIDGSTVLPEPVEIVYFRRALGWMGFKSMLERVIRAAIKNGLPERDCAILEKRYNKPLVELIKESPSDEYGEAILPPLNSSSLQGAGLSPADETDEFLPPLSENNLSELFERIKVPEPPPPIQMVKNPVLAESSLDAAAQMLWGGQTGTREPGSDDVIKSTRAGAHSEQGMSSSSPIRRGDQESDPLGIESFFDGINQGLPRSVPRSSGTLGRPEGYLPHRQPPKYGSSSSRLQAFYDETRARKNRSSEDKDSSDVQARRISEVSARGSASRLQRIEPATEEPEERVGDQRGDAFGSGERTPHSSPELPMNFSQSAQAPKEIISQEKPLPLRQNQKLQVSAIAPISKLNSLLSTEFLSRSLYIAVPILVLLAVYLMIGILRTVPPGPSTVESAQPARSSVESSLKSTPASVRPPQPTPAQTSVGSGSPLPGQPKQPPNPPQANVKPPLEVGQSIGTSVGSASKLPEHRRSTQVGDGVSEEPKKFTLIRHLRLEHGLDFNPRLYTYRELKDIDDRLEETLKKAAK